MAQLPTLSTDDFPEKTNSDENGALLETPYPGLNASIHYDADEYNRLSGAVIDNRGAVNDLDGRVEALEEGGGSSIADTAGTTSVETERTPNEGVIRMTAGGVEVGTLSATAQVLQSDIQAGRRATVSTRSDAYPGYPGIAAGVAPDGVVPGQAPSNSAVYFYGGATGTTETGGAAILASAVGAIGAERPEAAVVAGAGLNTGTGEAQAEATLSAQFGALKAGVRAFAKADGTQTLTFEANGSAATLFNDPANVDLPAAYASIVAALIDLEARRLQPWAATFAAGENVSDVQVADATQRVEGDYVTLTGALAVTVIASGTAIVTAPLPYAVIVDGAGLGVASGMDPQSPVMPLPAAAQAFDTTLSVFVDANGSTALVGFSITYKKAV